MLRVDSAMHISEEVDTARLRRPWVSGEQVRNRSVARPTGSCVCRVQCNSTRRLATSRTNSKKDPHFFVGSTTSIGKSRRVSHGRCGSGLTNGPCGLEGLQGIEHLLIVAVDCHAFPKLGDFAGGVD